MTTSWYHNSIEDINFSDKSDNFPQTSDHTKFSNSVVDVFTQLNEALKLLKQVWAKTSFCPAILNL